MNLDIPVENILYVPSKLDMQIILGFLNKYSCLNNAVMPMRKNNLPIKPETTTWQKEIPIHNYNKYLFF